MYIKKNPKRKQQALKPYFFYAWVLRKCQFVLWLLTSDLASAEWSVRETIQVPRGERGECQLSRQTYAQLTAETQSSRKNVIYLFTVVSIT